jgi:hypothetical protein
LYVDSGMVAHASSAVRAASSANSMIRSRANAPAAVPSPSATIPQMRSRDITLIRRGLPTAMRRSSTSA